MDNKEIALHEQLLQLYLDLKRDCQNMGKDIAVLQTENRALKKKIENLQSPTQPVPVYHVDKPKSIIAMTLPDENTGIWISPGRYADEKKIQVSTLRSYREQGKGAVWAPDTIWGIDAHKNIFRKAGRSYEYFLFHSNELFCRYFR